MQVDDTAFRADQVAAREWLRTEVEVNARALRLPQTPASPPRRPPPMPASPRLANAAARQPATSTPSFHPPAAGISAAATVRLSLANLHERLLHKYVATQAAWARRKHELRAAARQAGTHKARECARRMAVVDRAEQREVSACWHNLAVYGYHHRIQEALAIARVVTASERLEQARAWLDEAQRRPPTGRDDAKRMYPVCMQPDNWANLPPSSFHLDDLLTYQEPHATRLWVSTGMGAARAPQRRGVVQQVTDTVPPQGACKETRANSGAGTGAGSGVGGPSGTGSDHEAPQEVLKMHSHEPAATVGAGRWVSLTVSVNNTDGTSPLTADVCKSCGAVPNKWFTTGGVNGPTASERAVNLDPSLVAVDVTFHAMKVGIDRSAWFDPTFFASNGAYRAVQPTARAAHCACEHTCEGGLAPRRRRGCMCTDVLASYPTAFLIARDISIKATLQRGPTSCAAARSLVQQFLGSGTCPTGRAWGKYGQHPTVPAGAPSSVRRPLLTSMSTRCRCRDVVAVAGSFSCFAFGTQEPTPPPVPICGFSSMGNAGSGECKHADTDVVLHRTPAEVIVSVRIHGSQIVGWVQQPIR